MGDGPRQSGFTLVGVVVAIAILTILIAAVGPTVSTVIERERETELIFRGKQYARAIQAFQKRYGRYPNELKELFKNRPRTIRRLWLDPMCNCDDWKVLIAGSPEAAPMGQQPPPGGAGPGGLKTTPRPGDRTPTPGFGEPTPPPFLGGGGSRVPTPAPTPPSSFGPQTGKAVGPIVGVRTKIRRQAIRKWKGREFTDEWRFIAGDADSDQAQPFDPQILFGPHRTPQPGAR